MAKPKDGVVGRQQRTLPQTPDHGDGASDGEQIEFVAAETAAAAMKTADSGRPPSLMRKEQALANLRFAYRPMWDSVRNVVSAYRCRATCTAPTRSAW